MSEISLRDYFTKLEQLLNTNAADEVIHHCRHILQYYPKNVTAYRYLGRALLLNGRWDEATAALRRVLSVIPDDFPAHVGLSEIYDHKKKPDEAIWHLERAFEQNPNSGELLDRIRSLYRRYRDVDQAKVQLTAAAVARQALRNHAYDHAIDTLRDALERQSDRIDLRNLLAQTLWESDDHVEAAETALDVLQVLPDCLEANRILTMLWLEEDRPSDAQRYLNRVEAIDPYLAVEVAQGQPAPDDAFRLQELDYVRSAQSALTENRPDWLQDISAEVPQVGQEDWSNFMSSMLASSAQAQVEDEQPVPDLFGDDATAMVEKPVAPPAGVEDYDIPAEFAPLPPTSPSSDDATTLTPIPSPMKASDSEDPMAWLHDSGVELLDDEFKNPFEEDAEPVQVDQPEALAWLQQDLSTEDAGAPSRPMPDAEAFSWMQSYDVELAGEPSSPASPVEESAPASEDMPDWLKDEGFLEEALGIEQLTGNDSSIEPDWLNVPSDQETEFADTPEQTPPELRPTAPTRELAQNLEAALPDTDWLRDVSQDDPQPVPGPRRGLTAMLNEANLDWLQPDQESDDDLTSDTVMDEWLSQFGGSEPPAPAPPTDQEPVWLTELDTVMSDEPNKPGASDETPNWLPDAENSGTSEPSASEDEFSWLSSESEQVEPAALPDWMAELQPTASSSSAAEASDQPDSDEFDWSSPEPETEAAEPASMPDWMAELQPIASSSSAADAGDQSDNADTFDWSSQEPDAEAAEPEPPVAMPDWMAELEPTSTYEAPSPVTFEQENASEGEFEWLAEDGTSRQALSETEADDFTWLDEAAVEAQDKTTFETALPATAADSPTWLSELQPQEQDERVVSPDDQSWLNEAEIEAEAGAFQDESVVPAVIPDWLSEIQPQEQAEPEAEPEPAVAASEDYSWLDEVGAEAPVEPAEEQPAVVPDTPDWLSEIQPQEQAEPEAEPEPVVAASEDYSWLDEVGAEAPIEPAEEQPAVVPDTPDWLSEIQPQEQAEPEAELEPVVAASEDYAWLDQVKAEAEPAAEPEVSGIASDDYDWLDEVESDAVTADTESTFADANESISQSDMETGDWDSAAVPSFTLVEDADDEDDYWLNDEEEEVETVTGGQPLEDDINVPEGMTVFSSDEMDMMQDESFEPIPASNAPDWLNAMVPGLDVDFEATEDEPLEEFMNEAEPQTPAHSREFEWVEEIVEEESRQPETTTIVAEPARPRYIFSRPPTWLNEPAGPINHDDELPDWPSDVPEWLR
jgi:tetratricopeptide (TPR) repeat protein